MAGRKARGLRPRGGWLRCARRYRGATEWHVNLEVRRVELKVATRLAGMLTSSESKHLTIALIIYNIYNMIIYIVYTLAYIYMYIYKSV